MKWCRVEFGEVTEITDIDPKGRFHPDFGWMQCKGEVQIGWIFVDGKFIPKEIE